MLERRIYKTLIDWKNKEDKMTLLVKGARQIGKTFIIDKFAKENYKNYVYINFDENENYKTIFEGDLDVDTIIKQMTLRIKDCQIVPGETIVFLDEIQSCPRAKTALKFITIDKRFDCIASGSLLGLNYANVPSYPVGYVEHLEMFSLDFEEFCWANGVSKKSIEDIKYYFDELKVVPEAMHEKMLELFKEYIVIGGMPKAVNDYINNFNYNNVLYIQKNIVADYLNDITKYAPNTVKTKARDCFLSIPTKHLTKDYKKFRYSLIKKNSRSKDYEGSLMWLYDAGIINFCYNVTHPELPLEGNSINDIFKVYMKDTGLLVSMLEEGSAVDIIEGNLGIYKGAIYENIIADILSKKGKKLYYFERNSTLEIDFIIRHNNKVTGVEVKSSDNTKAKSLNILLNNYNVDTGIKLSLKI